MRTDFDGQTSSNQRFSSKPVAPLSNSDFLPILFIRSKLIGLRNISYYAGSATENTTEKKSPRLTALTP
ncbi:hypothetical protein JXA32_01350 [Candidatus Sumerlaeota bacterium]|nr:hypothetical protein [Candidatus Sumerlaeota bacterium]